MPNTLNLYMMLPKVAKHIFLEKTMSQKKSARFTGPKKKALDFSKTVRLNKGTLFFVRKEVQVIIAVIPTDPDTETEFSVFGPPPKKSDQTPFTSPVCLGHINHIMSPIFGYLGLVQ